MTMKLFSGFCRMMTLRSIKEARERIRSSIVTTPFVHSEKFSQQTGNSVFLKLENLQMTGAFKERGALNKILLLSDEERRRGVIAASAGNHAQAVGLSCGEARHPGADLHAPDDAARKSVRDAWLRRGSHSCGREL